MGRAMRPDFEIGGKRIKAGLRDLIDLPVAMLSNHTPVTLPVHVLHGRREGPVVFINAAIHGDEVVGVEIIRRLLSAGLHKGLRGTLLFVPIVNAFGFIAQTRYLPDRRDLNRCFPGAAAGSLAGQIAHLFLHEIVAKADLGIDLHTGAINRSNLPQLRGDFVQPRLRDLAMAFGPPVILQSKLREGSLRHAAKELGVNVLVYEAGEALRLDELSVRAGMRGILRVLFELRMTNIKATPRRPIKPVYAEASRWMRADDGGLFSAYKTLGDSVVAGDVLGVVTNPYDGTMVEVKASRGGVIIGRTNISVVNSADALFNIAQVAQPAQAEGRIEEISDVLDGDPIFDDDEIV